MRKWIARMRVARGKIILAGLGLAVVVVSGIAIAQVPGLFIASPTGLEQINVLVPSTGTAVTSPQITTITVNQIRNAVGHALVATGTTVTSAPANTVGCLVADGAITTWNITLAESRIRRRKLLRRQRHRFDLYLQRHGHGGDDAAESNTGAELFQSIDQRWRLRTVDLRLRQPDLVSRALSLHRRICR